MQLPEGREGLMPKIRGVKPELWTDESFVELSPYARLLWIGLWNHACDNGHLQDKSKQIKMRVLPTDDVNCADLLREIEAQNLIERGDGWITIPNLSHHQKPHKRWFVVCEKPGCEHPEGTSYGFDKPKKANPERGSTVEQPLVNDETASDNGCSTADVDVDVDGDLMVIQNVSPTDVADAPSSTLALVSRDDVLRLCDHLADRIEANGSNRPTIGKGWHDAARLMLDRDGRTEQEIHGAIDWCQQDEFWRSNILSMPKLREKYDQLRLQAQRQGRAGTPRQQAESEMWDRAYARAAAREGDDR